MALPLGRDAITVSLALCLSERVPVMLDPAADQDENLRRLKRAGAVAVIAEKGSDAWQGGELVLTPDLLAPLQALREAGNASAGSVRDAVERRDVADNLRRGHLGCKVVGPTHDEYEADCARWAGTAQVAAEIGRAHV